MRLVACPACHTQYDVSDVDAPVFNCRCGAEIRNEVGRAVEAEVQRCSSCGALLPDGARQCEYCHSAVVPEHAQGSLICPECFARNDEQAHFCRACGLAFQPEKPPPPGTKPEKPLSCPCCQEPMSPRNVGGMWIRECTQCSGLWVPEDRLDTLIQRSVETARRRAASGLSGPPPQPRRVATDFTYRHCPVCGTQMYRKNFGHHSGVIVDWCGAHGTWLDKDELEQIAHFVAEGGLQGGDRGLAEHGTMNVEQARAMAQMDRIRAMRSDPALLSSAFSTTRRPGGIVSILERLSDLLR